MWTTAEENEIAALYYTPASPRPRQRRHEVIAAHRPLAAHASLYVSRLHRIECIVIVLALVWLFVGPRVELPAISGLRVEDFVFVVLALICAIHLLPQCLRSPDTITAPSVAMLIVTLSGLLSTFVASLGHTVNPMTSVLYALRPLEYWTVFPAAGLLLRQGKRVWIGRMRGLLACVTVLQSLVAVLQYVFTLPIGFSHASYARAAGLTVGPYELGAISAALLVYWATQRRIVLAVIAAVGLLLSISRISLLGAVLALALLAAATIVQRIVTHRRTTVAAQGSGRSSAGTSRSLRTRLLVVCGAVAIAAVLTGGALLATPGGQRFQATTVGPIIDRFTTTSVIGSWARGAELAAAVPRLPTAGEYQNAAYTELAQYVHLANAPEDDAEPSNLVRFFRWNVILNNIDTPTDVIFGLGPSFVGPSVDGSYLRFLADAGVIGILAWLVLIATWVRRMPVGMISITVSLLVGASFIDILYSERPMALFWAILAMAYAGDTMRRRSGRHVSRSGWLRI